MTRTTAPARGRAPDSAGAADGVDLSIAYRRWGALIYTMALRGTGDPAVARDVTARAFAAAWRPGLPAEDLKVALTAAARRETLAVAEPSQPGASDLGPAAREALLDRLVVRDDLTDLRDPDRTVMLQLINSGADRRAIADRLGLDEDEVAVIIARSLQAMRGRLEGSRGRG